MVDVSDARTRDAKAAAQRLLARRNDVAIDTADYLECGFIVAAAALVLENAALLEEIGSRMAADDDRVGRP